MAEEDHEDQEGQQDQAGAHPYADLIDFFCATHPLLAEGWKETKAWWHPEEVPVGIILGHFGSVMAKQRDAFSGEQLVRLCAFVEAHVNSSDSTVADGMATQLLEAIVSVHDVDKGTQALVDLLGPESIAYCEAWNAFNGITAPLRSKSKEGTQAASHPYAPLIDFFCEVHPLLAVEWKETKEWWAPEEVPLGTILGHFGRKMAKQRDAFSQDQLVRLCEFVETHVNSPDTTVANGMATELLEAILSVHDVDKGVQGLVDLLGPESIAYCEAWNEVNGITAPLRSRKSKGPVGA